MSGPQPRYIGDGVYASFDGYHIWLLTGSHDPAKADDRIALEPQVLEALDDYRRSLATFHDAPQYAPHPEEP